MSSSVKINKRKSVWKRCKRNIFRILSCTKKPLDESPTENPVEEERAALSAEVIQSVSSATVSDGADCGKLTTKTAAVTSDDQKLEKITTARDSRRVPAKGHDDCVNEQQLDELRTEVQKLTDVVRVMNARLHGIIAKLHEQEDSSYGDHDEEGTAKRVLPGGDFDRSGSQAKSTGDVSGLNISPE